MRALVRFAVGLGLTILAHLALAQWLPGALPGVDLFLVFLTYGAIGVPSLAGTAMGLTAGLAADAVSGSPFGLFGLAGTLVGYGVARLTQHVVIERAGPAVRLFVAASLVHQALVVAVGLLVLPDPPSLPGWIDVVLRAASSGALGLVLFVLGRGVRRRLGNWQQARPAKVRWGR